MKLLFVRHALALEREEWSLDDLERPLSEKGEKSAEQFFKKLKKIYEDVDVIISSKATRAKQTAKILACFYEDAKYIEDERLNPGMTFGDFTKVLKDLESKYETLFIVGHEPDFSETISGLISSSPVRLKLKKPSLVEVDVESKRLGELRAIIYPKQLKEL